MRLIFRPIRTAILCLMVFVAGIYFERAHQQQLCEESGGNWARVGICTMEVTNG